MDRITECHGQRWKIPFLRFDPPSSFLTPIFSTSSLLNPHSTTTRSFFSWVRFYNQLDFMFHNKTTFLSGHNKTLLFLQAQNQPLQKPSDHNVTAVPQLFFRRRLADGLTSVFTLCRLFCKTTSDRVRVRWFWVNSKAISLKHNSMRSPCQLHVHDFNPSLPPLTHTRTEDGKGHTAVKGRATLSACGAGTQCPPG